uniref:BolA-like protein 2 n=1 Tax=Panthera leo TaxID=9689 RepID=A0A8C8Y1V9_PANLE
MNVATNYSSICDACEFVPNKEHRCCNMILQLAISFVFKSNGVRAGAPSWLGYHSVIASSTSERKQQQDLEAVSVEAEDTTPNHCTSSFQVLVVSAKFKGKLLLQKHGLVNRCLAEELLYIHAFEQKTLTPEQWAYEWHK